MIKQIKDTAGMPIDIWIIPSEDHEYGPTSLLVLEAEMPFNHSALMRFNPQDAIAVGEMMIQWGKLMHNS